jgi:hypothetical protein
LTNQYRGDVGITGLGVLRFDWERLARLVALLGPDFDTKLSKAATNYDLDTVAQAVSIGLGGLDPDRIKAHSPPIVPTVAALMAALNLAFHGAKEPPPVTAGENPPRMKRAATSLPKRGKKRSARG